MGLAEFVRDVDNLNRRVEGIESSVNEMAQLLQDIRAMTGPVTLRLSVLDRALRHARGTNYTAVDIVRIARVFEAYINGQEDPQ